MDGWGVLGIVAEGQPIYVGGLNLWDHEWRQVEIDPIELPHPQYPLQMHQMRVCEIEGSVKQVKFAAGEVSANVWGFYVPVR
jgi:hypothetical protein